MNNKVSLVIGAVLIAIGIFRPDFSSVIPKAKPTVDLPSVTVSEPEDPSLKEAAVKVADILKNGGPERTVDGLALAGLYGDIAKLISLDSENQVVKTTSEIREINSVAGSLMNLKLQGKYPNLAVSARELVVEALGDDIAVLNETSREKAVDAFEALSWGCFEGTK